MSAQLILDALKNKGWPQTVVISAMVAIATWKLSVVVVDFRDRLVRELSNIRTEAQAQEERTSKKIEILEAQVKRMWTVDMQVIRDGMVVARNTNVWVPDGYRIYEAIRQGKAPDAVRITSP